MKTLVVPSLNFLFFFIEKKINKHNHQTQTRQMKNFFYDSMDDFFRIQKNLNVFWSG